MKRFTIALFAIAGMISLLSVSSCKKVWDYVKQHPDGVADNCSVEKITFTELYYNSDSPFAFNDTLNFTYNNSGNLTQLNYASTKYHYYLNAYSFDSYFKYDNSNRLTVYLEQYNQYKDQFYALFWHKYNYLSATQIIDTIFVYANGTLNNDNTNRPEGEPLLRINRITLDDYGRIIKEEGLSEGPTTYSYDQAGNLILPGVTYTNKTSIYQTSKTLMFFARNYSVNTPATYASQFNSNSLPTKFNNGKIPPFIFGADFSPVGVPDQKIRVSYKCK